jgi:hypothetical protein
VPEGHAEQAEDRTMRVLSSLALPLGSHKHRKRWQNGLKLLHRDLTSGDGMWL